MLFNFRYRYATLLPTVIGMLLFIFQANHNIYALLSRVGLSVAHKTVLKKLRQLGADSDTQVREWVKECETGPFPAQIIFDNINKMRRAWEPSLGHQDNVQSGTSALLIKLVDVPDGAFKIESTSDHATSRASLTVDDMLDDIDWMHLRGVGRGLILRIFLKHIPSLRRHRSAVEKLFSETHAKHRLTLRKSEIRSLRCSAIDESTTAGTLQVIDDIVRQQLAIPEECLENYEIPTGGDQLSIDRLRKGVRATEKGDTPGETYRFTRKKLEMWHTKYNWAKASLRLNWWTDLGKDIFGLHHDCELLGRKLNPNNADFYPMHGLLEVRYEALVLEALRWVCC